MKFKQMAIICNDTKELRKIYFDKCVNASYIVDITDEENICEIAKDKIEIMQINGTVILSVNEFCSVKDMIGELKTHKLNAVVLENLATTYDKKYIGFKTWDELADFVINKNKKFKFIDLTVKILLGKWSTDAEKMSELCAISCDDDILHDDAKEMFIF